ncbi:site-specific integrase [Geomicrobium sp. JCM 19039]|uniref:site-specific integrase n=1 Tax=Geomicrobium sp. JCM 19039 TaxID=1460636 RepID=UPI00045F37E4|nr:site-specific integrase [Geomicrobium sp. JCM 19039]GAK12539.1 integrase [Geomicrobium sp. JCM 19039]
MPSKRSSKAQINYNKEQIWALIDAIKTEPLDKQVLFWIAFITSAREAEIAALDDNSILIDECAIRIDKSLGELSGGGVEIIPTKNHLEGVAAIPETLMVMVEKLLLDKKKWKMLMRDKWEYPDNVFLFCNDHGRPIRPDSISQWWIRFIKKNQLPKVRFHDLRHISITFLISQNLPMKSISSRARHSKIGTTMDIYGHSIVEVDREAAQLFEQFFSKKEG